MQKIVKEMIIRKVSPEVLSANTDMKCTVKTEEIVKVEKPKEIKQLHKIIPNVGTVISSEVVDVVKMKPKVISTSQYRDYVLGNNATVQLNNSRKRIDYCNYIRII